MSETQVIEPIVAREPAKKMDTPTLSSVTLTAKNIGDLPATIKRLATLGLLGKEVNLDRRGRHEVLNPAKIIPLDTQRDAKLQWAVKSVIARKGWDWGASGVLSVVRVDGIYYAWDGNGRLLLAQLNGIPGVDCWVFDGTKVEGAEHFVYNQKDGRRSLTNEQIFVNEVASGNVAALQTLEDLKVVGLAIEGAKDLKLPEGSKDPLIKYNAFDKTLKLTKGDLKVMRLARDIIRAAYPNDNIVRAELFGGLSFLLYKWGPSVHCGPELERFKEYIIPFMKLSGAQGQLPFKAHGGNCHNDEHGSIAQGIHDLFMKSNICRRHRGKYPHVILRKMDVEDDDND